MLETEHRPRAPRISWLAAVLALFAALALARAWYFYFYPSFPFAYYKDLGVDFQIAQYIRHSVHSLTDFKDMLGWSAWYDQPLFFLNPYLSYLAIVPVSVIVFDTWSAIKLLEIVQLAIAAGGTFWLLRLFGRPRIWAICAGLLYAFVPLVALAPRGNLDIGWAPVLAPVALAVGVALIRRHGALALPLCGVVCSICGLCTAVEFLVYLSAPAYVLLTVYAFRRAPLWKWAVCAAVGLVFLISTGAYFLVPTFVGPLFSDSASRATQLSTGSILPLFSQTWETLAALVPREAVVSPVPVYNASDVLGYATAAGALLWLCAFIGLLVRRRSVATAPGTAALLIGAILTVVSLGVFIVGGDALWTGVLVHIPVINAIRTPDRYLLLPGLFVVIAGVEGLRALYRLRLPGRIATVVALVFIFGLFAVFDAQAHVFENQPTVGTAEPQLAQANDEVLKLGGRTASFALVNGGSPQDYPSYGVPAPTISGVWELQSRYLNDGLAGVGIFRRAGIASIVATPMWAENDASGFPDSAAIYRKAPFSKITFESPEDVIVTALQAPDAMVAPVSSRCLLGGPGLLDALLAAPGMDGQSLSAEAHPCNGAVLANFDAYDALTAEQSLTWDAGAELCGSCEVLRDVDYAYAANRMLFKNRWYRNSVDGDAPVFDSHGTVLINDDRTFSVPVNFPSPGSYEVAIRGAAHGPASISVGLVGQPPSQVATSAPVGLRWSVIPLTIKSAGPATISLTISAASKPQPRADSSSNAWRGFAFDGVAVVSTAATSELKTRSYRAAAVAMSVDRLESGTARNQNVTHLFPGAVAAHSTGLVAASVKLRPALELAAKSGTVTYRWVGPSGTYVLEASAILAKPGAGIGVQVSDRPGTCCANAAFHGNDIAEGPAGVLRTVSLHRGDYVTARLTTPAYELDSDARLVSLSVIRNGNGLALRDAGQAEETGELNLNSPEDLAQAVSSIQGLHSSDLSVDGLHGRLGASFGVPLHFNNRPSSVTVSITAQQPSNMPQEQSALVRLICGDSKVERTIWGSEAVSVANTSGTNDCHLSLYWNGALIVSRLIVSSTGTILNASGRRWIPAGTYTLHALSAQDEEMPLNGIRIDGRQVSGDNAIRFVKSADHAIMLQGADPRIGLLLLNAVHPSQSAARLRSKQLATLRWKVDVTRAGDVKVNHLYDGHWTLQGSDRAYTGERCDLVDTCFRNVRVGSYILIHRWPWQLKLGITITLITLLCGIGLLFIAAGNREWPIFRRKTLHESL